MEMSLWDSHLSFYFVEVKMKERSELLTVYDCLPSNDARTFNDHSTSGVATLGHTGARALPVQR